MFVHNLTFLKELSKNNDSIAIIGKGKNADKYVFDKNKIIILTINDSILNYKNYSHCTCIVEGHLNKNLPIVMDKIENGIIIKRHEIKQNELVVGCTPSIVISYLIKHTFFKNIYLQGFSMDGAVILNDPTIEQKTFEIFVDTINTYEEKNINEAYNYFRYQTSEFVGQSIHYPYEWNRQIAAFEECFRIADEHNKKLTFITECTRKSKYFQYEEVNKKYLSF